MRLKRLPINKCSMLVNKMRSSMFEKVNVSSKQKFLTTSDSEINVDLTKSYILKKEEYNLLTETWSKSTKNQIPKQPIHKFFEGEVEKHPSKKAVIINEESYTYRELNETANQLAAYLIKQGIKLETPVAIYLDRSFEMIISILAVLKAGGVYIPIDPLYPQQRVSEILVNSQSKFVITNKEVDLNNINIINVNINLQKELSACSMNNCNTLVPSDALAYIIYTSGSTGIPKGVEIEHQSLVSFILAITKNYEISEKDIIIQFASIAFDVSVFDIFTALCNGATLCIANEEERKSPVLLTELMKKNQVTVAELPPALLPLLSPKDFPMLRLISVGGEKFSGEIVNQWANSKRRFVNGYGPTETTVAVTLYDCVGTWDKNPPIGKPMENVEAYVLNEQLQPVPIGIPGELYIGGSTLARGYVNRPDLTAEKFIKHPFSNNENDRLYKTGDLVKWLSDGNLEIIGRIDRQVKIRGFRIELSEIESKLAEHTVIKQVTVQTIDSNENGKQLVAYYVREESNSQIDINDLQESLATKLPNYMIPSLYVELDNLPLTSNGKIDIKALPEPGNSRVEDGNYVEPRDEVEQQIAYEIFAPILGINKVSAFDNFFYLGGNSLQATLIVSRIRNIFGIEVNLIDFFQSPTVESLAQIVKEKKDYKKSKQNTLLKELNQISASWLKIYEAPDAKFRLVCFPYAGASPYLFKDWPEMLAPDFEVVTIELPGHGIRIKEKPFDVAFDVANRLASELEKLSDKPLIFMGHSGGAILAFETSRILFKKGISIYHLFALASRAPHQKLIDPPRYNLPKEQFLSRVNEFGGLSDELLNNEDVLEMMIPAMRADEKLAENYLYIDELNIFSFPITAYGGKEDIIKQSELEKWKELCTVNFECELFEGGHFFLQEQEDVVLSHLIESISNSMLSV